MSNMTFALAVILALGPLMAGHQVAASLPWVIPSLRLSGTVRAAQGHQLHTVSLTLGEEPIDADAKRFVLVAAGGTYAPIGAGGRADIIIPFDRIPLGREVGEILPSDAVIALTRTSATTVMLEVGPRGTVAFLFELPLNASVRALRLPDGRELVVAP